MTLPHTVIGMKMHVHFTQSIVLKVIVQKANNTVATFPSLYGFIQQECDLFWQGLTRYTKNSTFTQCFKIHRTWFEGIIGVVNLLCKVHAIMYQTRQFCFLCIRPIGSLTDLFFIFLSCPTQVSCWLHCDNKWRHLPPDATKCDE